MYEDLLYISCPSICIVSLIVNNSPLEVIFVWWSYNNISLSLKINGAYWLHSWCCSFCPVGHMNCSMCSLESILCSMFIAPGPTCCTCLPFTFSGNHSILNNVHSFKLIDLLLTSMVFLFQDYCFIRRCCVSSKSVDSPLQPSAGLKRHAVTPGPGQHLLFCHRIRLWSS